MTAARTRTGLAELGSKDEDVLGSNEKEDSGSEDKDMSQVEQGGHERNEEEDVTWHNEFWISYCYELLHRICLSGIILRRAKNMDERKRINRGNN